MLKKCLINLFPLRLCLVPIHAHRQLPPTLRHSISRVVYARGGKEWKAFGAGVENPDVREVCFGEKGRV